MPSFAEHADCNYALYVRHSPEGQWLPTSSEKGRVKVTKSFLTACDYGKELVYIAYKFSDGIIWDSHDGWFYDTSKPLENLPSESRVTVFDEAKEIIYGDREQTYGHPAKNLQHIAEQWNMYIKQKYDISITLVPGDVCWMMADLKKAREMNAAKHDNLVDAIGYIGLVSRVKETPQ